MKKLRIDRRNMIAMAVVLVQLLSAAPKTLAAPNKDECSIWLCLVVGFVYPECAKSHRAMTKRLFQGESALPSFSECSVDGSSEGMDVLTGPAAVMDTTPTTYMNGTACVFPENSVDATNTTTPRGCLRTARYIIVKQNGVQIGETYYTPWRPRRPANDEDS